MFKFKPGDIYKNHFKIIQKIAEGGQAITYLILDTSQGKKKQQTYVLKVAEMKPKDKQKILAQYKYIKQFDHPNIIKAYSAQDKQINGILYFFIIMEYAEGGALKMFLGKLDEKEILKIYHQVKSAIQYIHKKEVIHRDLTLSNILLDKMKNVKVIDFGIATQLGQQKTHTITQYQEGKRLYNPQQFVQDFIVSKQNDLWQFGITLIQLVTGKGILELTNNKMPYSIKNFVDQVFKNYNVNNEFRSIIFPLLRNKYKERKFYDDNIKTISKIYKIKPRQPIQSTQIVVYKTTKISQVQQLKMKWKVEINQQVKKNEIQQKSRVKQVPQLSLKM